MASETQPKTVRFVFPAEEAALAETLERIPELRATLERSAASCQQQPSALWIATPDEDELFDALDADSSVEEYRQLASVEGRLLVDVDFDHTVNLLWSILLSDGGVLTDVTIHDGKWLFDCRFSDHGSFGTTRESLEDRAFEFEVLRISHGDEERPPGAVLSEKQYNSLKRAWEMGYFEVPRGATLEELADDMGLSHQALSERLRRGLELCVVSELALGASILDPQQEVKSLSQSVPSSN